MSLLLGLSSMCLAFCVHGLVIQNRFSSGVFTLHLHSPLIHLSRSIGPTFLFCHAASANGASGTLAALYDRASSLPASSSATLAVDSSSSASASDSSSGSSSAPTATLDMALEAHECRGLSGVVRPYARGQQLHHAPPLRHLQALQRLAVYSALYEVCSVDPPVSLRALLMYSDSVMYWYSVQ